VQAVLDGRVVVAGPRPRHHPDFPLRGFVRCETCGRPLTGSWSKGRNGHYAYYHCQRQCRAVNISKATLEGAFVDELALLQPTPGYMRLVKDRILCVWEQRRAEAKNRTTEQQRRVSAIQQKLDKLDEAFLYAEAIDVTTYGRQRDKLREELTLAKIDHHAEAVDELDVEGILAFAERILPRASDLWVQASLDYKQRLQQLFFPEGIAYDGNRFNRTAVTALLFKYLAPSESADERVVSRTGIEPARRRDLHARKLLRCSRAASTDLPQGRSSPALGPPRRRHSERVRNAWVDSLRDSLPDEQGLHHRLGEFGGINPQGHPVRTLECIPPPRGPTDGVRILIDVVAPVHEPFLRVDLQGCAVRVDTPERGQPFFWRRRGSSPDGPVRSHHQEAHVTAGRVKKCVADVGYAVCPLPCGAVSQPLRV
jgi:Recombinase zinc beta ribbon domain